MRLRLADCGIGGASYHSGAVPVPWRPGEEREVGEDLAAYLLRDFPGLFLLVSVAPVVEPMQAPALDRKVRGTGKRGRLSN